MWHDGLQHGQGQACRFVGHVLLGIQRGLVNRLRPSLLLISRNKTCLRRFRRRGGGSDATKIESVPQYKLQRSLFYHFAVVAGVGDVGRVAIAADSYAVAGVDV